jgi:hypothetical protein
MTTPDHTALNGNPIFTMSTSDSIPRWKLTTSNPDSEIHNRSSRTFMREDGSDITSLNAQMNVSTQPKALKDPKSVISPPRIHLPGSIVNRDSSIGSTASVSENTLLSKLNTGISCVTQYNNSIRRVMTPPRIMTPPKIQIYSAANALNDIEMSPIESRSPSQPTGSPSISAWSPYLQSSPEPLSADIDTSTYYGGISSVLADREEDSLGIRDTHDVSSVHRMRGLNKWEAFSLLYPHNTIPFTIRVNEQGARPESYMEQYDQGLGSWYATNDNYGGRVQIEPNDPDKFIEMIADHIKSGHGVGIYTTYNRQINVIWISADKEINRYEPQFPGGDYEQRSIDGGLSGLFSIFLPEYTYKPHRLEKWQCCYNPDTNDIQVEDYVTLYTVRRIKGMSHHDTVTNLIVEGDGLVSENTWLSRKLNSKMLKSILQCDHISS